MGRERITSIMTDNPRPGKTNTYRLDIYFVNDSLDLELFYSSSKTVTIHVTNLFSFSVVSYKFAELFTVLPTYFYDLAQQTKKTGSLVKRPLG